MLDRPVTKESHAVEQTNGDNPHTATRDAGANQVRRDAEPQSDESGVGTNVGVDVRSVLAADGWSALDLLKQFVTPTGLRDLPENMPRDTWLRLMAALGSVHAAGEWSVGDGYIYGEEHYGEEVAQGEVAAGREPKRLYNLVLVCKAIPPRSRLPGIRSFSVFEAAYPAYREQPETVHNLLLEAEANKWTGEQMKQALDELGLRKKAKEKAEPEVTYSLDELDELAAEYGSSLEAGMFVEWLRDREAE